MTGNVATSLASLVRDAVRAALSEVHTAFPARVERVDRDDAGWVVDVKPMYLRWIPVRGGGEKSEELPVIPQVPVVWPSAGGWGVSMPMAVGDHVLVIASEHAIGEWRARGEVCDPIIRGRHDLNGCFAIPGAVTMGRKFADALSSVAENCIIIGKDGGIQITMSPSEIKLGRSASSFAAKGDEVNSRIADVVAAFNAHTHTIVSGAIQPPSPAQQVFPTGVPSVECETVKIE